MNWGQHILIFGIRLYQRAISPALMGLFGPMARCRYTPSCSQYAREAIGTHGVFKGGALAVWRICRCNPWGSCGDDQVPPKSHSKTNSNFNSNPDACQAAKATSTSCCEVHEWGVTSRGRT